MVYLYFVSYSWLANNCLYDHGFLDEHKKVYSFWPPQSAEIFINIDCIALIKFDYNQTNYTELIKHYARAFGTKVTDNKILLPEKIGSGSISVFILSNGLQVFCSDYILKEDLLLTRKKNSKEFFLLRFEEVVVQSASQPLSKSAVILSGINNDHLFFQTARSHVKVFSLLFEKKWLQNFFTKQQGEDLLKYLSANMGTFIYEQMDSEYRLLVHEATTNEDKRFDAFIIKNRAMLLLERFFTRLYMKMTDAHFSLKISAEEIATLKIVEAELLKDFSEMPDLKKLSRMAAMSPSKFHASFKEMFGLPVFAYYQKHKMNKAKAMLISKKYTPKHVSEELGFSNFTNFAKAFAKAFDQSPHQIT